MIEKEISGVKRGFMFGTHTMKIVRELTGIQSVEEVFQGLSNRRSDADTEPLRGSIEYVDFLNKFFFACAKHYCESTGKPIDFLEANVGDWMDELGLSESMGILSQLIKTYTLKNQKAPAMGLAEQQ